MIEWLDVRVSSFVNGFARRWPIFDRLVLDVMQLPSVKLMPIVGCFVYLWFSGSWGDRRRGAVLDGLVGGFVALVVSRGIQNFSPHRPRPALSGAFDFVQPVGGYVNDWSSFPSDTSALALALVTAIFMGSRRLGVVALAWALVVVCFPRLYGGFHYLSDLAAGGLIGVCATSAAARLPLRDRAVDAAAALCARHRPLFYACAFVVAFQIATYFGDARHLVSNLLAGAGLQQAASPSPPTRSSPGGGSGARPVAFPTGGAS